MIRTSEFLAAFRGQDEPLHIRLFRPRNAPETPENAPLMLDTTLAGLTSDRDLQKTLITANETRGVYFSPNVGGATDASITRYVAWCVENDSLSIEEQHKRLDACPIRPSIRVETRKSVHAYWLIEGGCSEAEWRDIQLRLIAYFDGDPKIKNPARVMRVPGFDHLHLNGNGLEKKKVTVHTFAPEHRYTVAEMREAFPLPAVERQQPQTAGTFENHEDRHAELCQRIMSRGKRNSKGNWDATCRSHNGNGKTGLVYIPGTGAVACNNTPKCDYFAILRAEGLSDIHLPSREKTKIEKREAQAVRPSGSIFPAAELLLREFPALRWAIFSLLAEGLFILAGRPKLGKSWLVLNFAVAIACGGYALGTIQVEAGDVLYCALEDGARRLQERLRRALASGSVPDNLYLATEWRPFDRGGLDDLESWLKAHPTARLVVFDTLERVRPSEDPKARLYHSDYQAVQGLQDLAKEYGVCILVVHHTRKQDSVDHLDLVSGSTGLTGAADGVLILKRSRGESDATLTANGRDFPDTELALKFDGELCDWRALGDAAEYRLSNERREVIDLLRRSEPLTPKTVSELLGRDHSATKKLLWTMAKDGEAHADAKGRYSLVNAGIPGNRVTALVTTASGGNPNGNPKNHQKQSVLQGKGDKGYPVTTVTNEIKGGRYEPVFDDPERQQIWDRGAQ